MFHYIFIMFKHVNFGKHIWIHTSKTKKTNKKMFILKFHPRMKCLHVFFLFFIPGWNFIHVFLTGMSSSRDEISSRQKRVNSKRHFTIDRDDFVPGRVSSRDEISRVNTLSDKMYQCFLATFFWSNLFSNLVTCKLRR